MTYLLNPGVSAKATTLTVRSVAGLTAGGVILIGYGAHDAFEDLTITAVDAAHHTLTVTRGTKGTHAASHPGGSFVTVVMAGSSGSMGQAQGGGTANDAAALSLYLDTTTVGNIVANTASIDPNLHGPYTQPG
jgi:hypothetical protein